MRIRRGLVDRQYARSLQGAVPQPEGRVRIYYQFATVFLALYERIYAESGLQPSVKEVGYLLLGNASQG